MIAPGPSTTSDSASTQTTSELQGSARTLSPESTAAKKTDGYFKSSIRKDNDWWAVDCGDDRYGTLYSPTCHSTGGNRAQEAR